MKEDWLRTSKGRPCPVCEKPDWCLIARDGSAAICARIEAGAVRHVGGAGWLHRLNEPDRRRRHTRVVPIRDALRPTAKKSLAELADKYASGVSSAMLQNVSHDLGVTAASLTRLHIGWDGSAWTFPMRDAGGVVVGIRLRLADGRKLSVKGGREGVFIPSELPRTGTLYICEGPTDTAAILTLGLPAIGRPSCTGGLIYVLAAARGRRVVIVADRDANGSGQRGAVRLARALQPICPSVQVIMPPLGMKDAREWVRAGATRSDIESTIRNGPIVRFAEPTRRAVGVRYGETEYPVRSNRATA